MITFTGNGHHDLRPFIDAHGNIRTRVQFGFNTDDFTGINGAPADVASWLRDLAALVAAAEPDPDNENDGGPDTLRELRDRS